MISTTVIPNKYILNVDVYHKEGDKSLYFEYLLYDFCAYVGVDYNSDIYENIIKLGGIIILTDEELSNVYTFLPDSINIEQKEYLENLRQKGLFNNYEYLHFQTYLSDIININSSIIDKNLALTTFYEELENLITKSR